MMDWFVASIAIVGVVFNVRKKWQGFIFWLFTNAFWFGRNVQNREHAQAVTFAIFFFVCCYGIYSWRICKKRKNAIRESTIWICEKLLTAKEKVDEPCKIRVPIGDIIDEAGDLLTRLKNDEKQKQPAID